ncbi:MAG TPA: 3-isopropylmalate dehydratase large subunit [Gemmatimonadaceae bacterium]|nr:3-isopropylmalate dehydratase large subunit [Gemmatimonadaceae bacterium]
MSDRVLIFDTTLRDGEQAPGCSMRPLEKLDVARQLARLGVDVIEAGFPASSGDDAEAVATIAAEFVTVDAPVVCGLARATIADIDACAMALAAARRQRIHTFLATSDVHLRHKLRLTREEVLQQVETAVSHARSRCDDVEFSPEDAARSDIGFLCEVVETAIASGAGTINIPDTVGYAMPWEYEALIDRIVSLAAGRAVVSTHCHDDLGLAVANSLAGVRGGARQVECTVNGIGERAGNAALEEVVMALQTRASEFAASTSICTAEIARTSRMVAQCTGIHPPPNKAIVGDNAFAHEAGIHQDGVLKQRSTYEIMRAESVGRHSTLVLGKHSGRGALRDRMKRLGFDASDEQLRVMSRRMKEVAASREHGKLGSDDIEQIARGIAPPRTLFEKIWRAHEVTPQTDATPAVLYVDLHLVHEVTSPQAFAELRSRGLRVRQPSRTIATMDHSIPTSPNRQLQVLDGAAQAQLETLDRNCTDFGIQLYRPGDARQGIVHVIGPELGLTRPGMIIVCGDSHTSTHGAFGALAFGIGTSQVAHVLATQCLLQTKPRTMRVDIAGRLGSCVTAKDVILALIAQIGVAGAAEHVIEYAGAVVEALSMEERMTICNMSIEAGARAGMIAPDDTTFEYLATRPGAPGGTEWDAALERWRALRTDDGAAFDSRVALDASRIEPMITYGTNPAMGTAVSGRVPDPGSIGDASERDRLRKALDYMKLAPGQPLAGTPVDVVFVGSCTNSRLPDLRNVASVLRGKRVAPNVRMLVVPGSEHVKRQAEREGIADVIRAAGAEWRDAGCSMCIAMNGDQLAPGQLAVSTSNRNFEGRQGKGGRTLLASPLTAAAAAVTGRITDPRTL